MLWARILIWRILFSIFYGRPGQKLAFWVHKIVRWKNGENYAGALLFRWSRVFYPNRIAAVPDPFTVQGARFLEITRRRISGSIPSRRPRISASPSTLKEKLRIGCLNHFSGALSFGYEFAAGAPFAKHEIFYYDVPYAGQHLSRLENLPACTRFLSLSDPIGNAVESINLDNLDVLLITPYKDAFQYLDHVSTPAIVQVSSGKNFIHHERVAVAMMSEFPPSWLARESSAFCTITRSYLSLGKIYRADYIFDSRGIEAPVDLDMTSREPIIFCHGSSFKFGARGFLNAAIQLLREFPDYSLHLMSRDPWNVVAKIRQTFVSEGMAERFHYDGEFDSTRNEAGEVADPRWEICRHSLARAALALDAWPHTGGSTRFEAYLSGLPMVHMAVPENPGLGGTVSYASSHVPCLSASLGRAYDPSQYLTIARRILSDESYWTELAKDQLAIATKRKDAARWWGDFLACCDDRLGFRKARLDS